MANGSWQRPFMTPARSARRRALTIAIGALLVGGPASSPAVGHAALGTALHADEAPLAAPADPFVRRSGRSLVFDGKPFRFTGLNIYQANSADTCGGDLVHGTGLDDAMTAIGPGANVIRSWFFQSFATVNGQRDWSAFDHTIAVAKAHGKRIIATLANQWADCEPLAGYKDVTWYTDRYKDPDPGGTTSYRQFVTDMATRYADEPTIMIWQLINEAEVKVDQYAGCPPGDINDPNDTSNVLRRWAQDVGGAIRAVDDNHLISLGTGGGGSCGTQVWQYENVHSIPEIDLCESHDYDNDPIHHDPNNGLRVRFDQCANLNKPFFMGEVGIRRNLTPDGSPGLADLDGRAAMMAAKLNAEFANGVSGSVIWAWANVPTSPEIWDVGPGDPMLPELRRWGGGVAAGAGFDLLGQGDLHGPNTDAVWTASPVIGLPRVVSVDAAQNYALAVDADGGVWAWGHNLDGQLGDGTTIDRANPLSVAGLPSVTRVSGNAFHSLALAADGTVWAWGSNSNGQLGDGTTNPRYTAAQVPGLTDVVDIAAGYVTTYALRADGHVWAWGHNSFGELGYAGLDSPVPVEVAGINGVRSISAGVWHIAALRTDGTVWMWGLNSLGQLGSGSASPFYRPTPVAIAGLFGQSAISSGDGHTFSVTADRTAWAWGWGVNYQLGTETDTNQLSPYPIFAQAGIASLSGGGHHSLAAVDSGEAYGWGLNGGQIGQTYPLDVKVPSLIHGLEGRRVELVQAGEQSSIYLVDAIGSAPDAPLGVVAAAGDSLAQVSWQVPFDGGRPITGYTVTASPGGSTIAVEGTTTSATLGGLANGTSYTFTVTASNDVGSSGVSSPSAPVTPQLNAGQPQVATAPVTATSGGTASTDSGTGPTSTDPLTTTVVVPSTGSAGMLTIAETASNLSAPTGYAFLGQQVDILSTAPTTPTNPLSITFTIDESSIRAAFGLGPTDPLPDPTAVTVTRAESGSPTVVGACTSTGAGGTAIAPDPCVASRVYVNSGTDLQLTVLTSQASQWNAAIHPPTVVVSDGGFGSAFLTVAQGEVVDWRFVGHSPHSVTDALALGPRRAPWYDSGLKITGLYGRVFQAAGTYLYRSAAKKDAKTFSGAVAVPIQATPATGSLSTSFTVQWSSATIAGYVFDVQTRVLKAGSKKWTAWTNWKTGQLGTGSSFVPSQGLGTYAFVARLRNASTGAASGWSPEASVIVR